MDGAVMAMHKQKDFLYRPYGEEKEETSVKIPK